MSDTSLRGFYKLGKNELVCIFLNKAFVCCMIELILWFRKEMERKFWIIAKLSKEHTNEIKKQQMYEMKLNY